LQVLVCSSLPYPPFPSHSFIPPFCLLPFFPIYPLFSAFVLFCFLLLMHTFLGPSPIQLGSLGSTVSSPSGCGGARPTNGFWCILSRKSLSPDNTVDTYLHKFRRRTPAPHPLHTLLSTARCIQRLTWPIQQTQ